MVVQPAPAFADYFSRRNRSGRQVALLVGITVAACGIGAFAKEWATATGSFGMVIDYHILRWGMGELLWCWLAADHAFSELGTARKQGRMGDWRLTPNSAGGIGGAFAGTTHRLLVPSILLFALGDALHPYAGRPLAFLEPHFRGTVWAFQFGTPACMAVSHLATARLAVLVLTREAFQFAPTAGHWAWSLARLGVILLAVTAASLFGAYVLASAFQGPGPIGGRGLGILRLQWVPPLFLAGLLLWQVGLKWALAVAAARRLARVEFPADSG